MSQANVRSVDALRSFKQALVNFSEEARNALTGVEMEVRRTRNWLERDQMSYWKGQIKKSQEMLQQAKADLHRRQLSQMNSDTVSDAEQKEAVRAAKRRLEEAEAKVEKIRKWVPVLDHAISEYHSQSQPLGDRLSGGLVNSILLLDRMVKALEEYMATSAPKMAPSSTGGGGASTTSAAPTATKAAAATADSGSTAAAPAAPAPAANGTEAAKPAANGDGATAGVTVETQPRTVS